MQHKFDRAMNFKVVPRKQPIPDIGQPKLSGMPISKAIEILNLHQELLLHAREPDLRDALQLGIEALKRILADRGTSYQTTWYPLPSETEE